MTIAYGDYDEDGHVIEPPAEPPTTAAQDTTGQDAGRKSAATALVELAVDTYTLGVSTDGEPYAVPKTGPPLVRMLRGGKASLRAQLARSYFAANHRAAPQQALADALLVLEGQAADAVPAELHLRVAELAGSTYLDLGDATGRAVQITAAGWQVIEQPPVLFRRVLTGPLPVPVSGGSLAELWSLLNVEPADHPLLLAAVLSMLIPNIPHPILGLFGEQGTGKTTAAKVLSLLLDPTSVPVRKAPRDAESWVTAASGSWVVALDNLSGLPDWLSDSLCRAVTGDGDVRRRLYTDGDLVVFAFRRCLIVTGIDLGSVRGDLADRLLPIDLHQIEAGQRDDDAELWADWPRRHPRILGALLDLAASVKAIVSSVRLDSRPRMADFARVLAAVDLVMGTSGLTRYVSKAGTMAVDALTGDPFVVALRTSLSGDAFEGTSADLLDLAAPPADGPWRAPKGWPANARQVTTLLRRQAPVMRRAGWEVTELPAGHSNVLRWQVARPREARDGDSQGSPGSQPRLIDPPGRELDARKREPETRSSASVTRGSDPGSRSGASLASPASDEYGPSQDDERLPASQRRSDDSYLTLAVPAWTPQPEQVGDCYLCGAPSETVDELCRPCHVGCPA